MNSVTLQGKISRRGSLSYTPSGVPVLEFVIAAKQEGIDKVSVGYFDAICLDREAERLAAELRIGKGIKVMGRLWNRKFKNRSGSWVQETRIVVDRAELSQESF